MDAEMMLIEVNKAIYSIMVTGQEYRIGGRYFKRADLGVLRQMKRELEVQVNATYYNGLMDNTHVAVFDRR